MQSIFRIHLVSEFLMGSSNTFSSDTVEKVGDKVNNNLDELEQGGNGYAKSEQENLICSMYWLKWVKSIFEIQLKL